MSKWTKTIPKQNGWFWARWKGKYGWRITPAEVVILGPYGQATPKESAVKKFDRVVNVTGAGTLSVHRDVSDAKAKKVFNYKEIQFWSEPLTAPPFKVKRKVA